MQDFKGDLIVAVRQGRLERARELISSFCGLSFPPAWSESYILLCEALKNKQTAVAKLLLTCGSKVNIKSKASSNTPLHFAVKNGDIEIVKMILDKGANIEAKNGKGRTPLYVAIENEKIEVTELLLMNRAEVHARDNHGLSPLHLAAEIDCLQIIEHLLKYEANINCLCTSTLIRKGYAPLHVAVENCSKEIVTLLLSRGANVDVKTDDHMTPLLIAVKNAHLTIIKEILNFCPDINNQSNRRSLKIAVQGNEDSYNKIVEALLEYGFIADTPVLLHDAVEKGYLKIIEDLLKYGADVNMSSDKYRDLTPLHTAAKFKREEVAKLLISYEADINAQDETGKTPIFYAIENADSKIFKLLLTNGAIIEDSPELLNTAVEKECIEIVEALLQHDGDINASDEYGRTALHFAAGCGAHTFNNDNIKGEIAKLLLTKGANANAQTKKGFTPLHIAAKERKEEVAKLLITYGADINVRNRTGKTPIFYAIMNANSKITKLLLTNGANIKDSPELLNTAVQEECIEIVEALLLHDVDVNASDTYGTTALYLAIENVDLKITKLLLTNGANIKDSPELLNTAVKKECIEIVAALLQHSGGCDVDVSDKYGRTALHLAVGCGAHTFNNDNIKGEIAKLLLTKGANTNAQSRGGFTPLHIAAKQKKKEVAKLLIGYEADINAQDETGNTPIFYAIKNGDSKITRLLLTNGANIKDSPELLNTAVEKECIEIVTALLQHDGDVNDSDEYGRTALHFAAGCGVHTFNIDNYKGEIAKLLLTKGANTNAQTEEGFTPLHIAAKEKKEEVAKLLIRYEADINAQDETGKTPIFYAIENADSKIFKLLLTNGANIKDSPELLNTAVEKECIEIVEALLQHNADVNASDEYGLTALHFTAECNGLFGDNDKIKVEIVKLLLTKGANTDAQTKNGTTTLHLAAGMGFKRVIETLLKFGADINSRDDDGRTALHFASEKGCLEGVETLLKYGSDINIIFGNNNTAFDCAFKRFYDLNREDDGHYYDHDYEPTAKALKSHIVKMKIANLYVSEKNLLSLNHSYKIDLGEFEGECEKEIASMKCEKINNTRISFYDILVKDTISLEMYLMNENIMQVLKSEDYETKFPIYSNMIEGQFRKAMERKELLERSNIIFQFLIFPELPYDCTEKIFGYLSDKDLRIFTEAGRNAITI